MSTHRGRSAKRKSLGGTYEEARNGARALAPTNGCALARRLLGDWRRDVRSSPHSRHTLAVQYLSSWAKPGHDEARISIDFMSPRPHRVLATNAISAHIRCRRPRTFLGIIWSSAGCRATTPIVPNLIEEPLDEIACPIKIFAETYWVLAIGLGRNVRWRIDS